MSRRVELLDEKRLPLLEAEAAARIGMAFHAAEHAAEENTLSAEQRIRAEEAALSAFLAGLSVVIEDLHREQGMDKVRPGFCGRCGLDVPDINQRVEKETSAEAGSVLESGGGGDAR